MSKRSSLRNQFLPDPHRARGFALPVVLVTLAALGAIATSVVPKGAVGIVDTASFEWRARERLLIEAALARGIHALLVSDDPLTERLLQGEPVEWHFAGRALSIVILPENDKLDVNAADPGSLATALDLALGPELGPAAHATALSRRGELSMPEQILPLIQRFSLAGARLRDTVTVFGGRLVSDRMQGLSSTRSAEQASHGRPIYTVQASLKGGSRLRTVTVLIEPERRRHVVLDRAEFEGPEAAPDQ